MKVLSLCIILALISFSAGACESTTGPEEPDIPDAPFVWRVCNQHDRFEMRNVSIAAISMEGPIVFDKIEPSDCTDYMTTSEEGENPPHTLSYEQYESKITMIYLDAQPATRGLIDEDSLWIGDVPGRYSYHIYYDSTRRSRLEIEREAYH